MEAFDARYLTHQYVFLEQIPEKLFDLVLQQYSGRLEERAAMVSSVRAALLSGEVPNIHDFQWPTENLRQTIIDFLIETNLGRFTKGQPEIVDELLADILRALLTAEPSFRKHFERIKEELVTRERQSSKRAEASNPLLSNPFQSQLRAWAEKNQLQIEPTWRAEILAEARCGAEEIVGQEIHHALLETWRERLAIWDEILDVFGTLGGLLGRGLDYARGLLRSMGWAEIQRLQKILKKLPQLRDLIESLGRMQSSDDDSPAVMETIFASFRRGVEGYEEIRTPFAPMETRGVRRSNDLSRLLPAEALNLLKPRLRYLFYARMHEHALSTYLVEGVMPEKIEIEEDIEEEIEREVPDNPSQKGPIIACIDTSGSMRGTPETVAKALVLQAIKVAHEERRPCYLIAFSGSGQIDTLELSLEPEGISELIAFLQRSFYGGTDLQAPLRKALDLMQRQKWEKADILLVSDGKFGAPESFRAQIDKAREEKGLRVHGVLIGRWASRGMETLCDKVHCFDGWNALGAMR